MNVCTRRLSRQSDLDRISRTEYYRRVDIKIELGIMSSQEHLRPHTPHLGSGLFHCKKSLKLRIEKPGGGAVQQRFCGLPAASPLAGKIESRSINSYVCNEPFPRRGRSCCCRIDPTQCAHGESVASHGCACGSFLRGVSQMHR